MRHKLRERDVKYRVTIDRIATMQDDNTYLWYGIYLAILVLPVKVRYLG